jgi:hypothetical protein
MDVYQIREFYQPDMACTLMIAEQVQPPTGNAAYRHALWHGTPGDEQAAAARAATYLDAAGKLARTYDPEADDHLRIYGVAGCPPELLSEYFAHRAPLRYDWGLLGLQKASTMAPADHGDISQMLYSHDGEAVARRVFAFDYDVDAQGATELTVTETPSWARNDGTWVSGPSKSQTYSGQRYNEWRDSARTRIFGGLKTWLPRVLVALEEVADVPEGEAVSGAWLATNHAAPWNLYMATGRKEAITATLTADTTEWLDSEIPANVIDVPANTTVRAMIIGALR